MRYLVLAADYLEPSIRDEMPVDDLGDPWDSLSPQLCDEIARWNDEYQVIIPMDVPVRATALGLIETLDDRGLDLANRIGVELSPAKVRYYSEGLLKYRG